VPKIPAKPDTGNVKPADFALNGCLPEIEYCRDRTMATRLPIEPPVTSVGFVVWLTLTFKDLTPGMRITGVVALSED